MKSEPSNQPEWVGAVGYCYICSVSLTLEPGDHPYLKMDNIKRQWNGGGKFIWKAHCMNCNHPVEFIHKEE